MARPRFPRLKDGQQLEPQHLNVIYAELERWNKTIGAGGVVFENKVSGPVISGGGGGAAVIAVNGLTRVISTSAITGRSGSTPGTGTGAIVTYNGTAYSTGAGVTLKTVSSGGHATGKYGWAVFDAKDENYHIVSMDC
jgi:hypothetical protein